VTALVRTPDDLDALLEDASMVGDPASFRALFDERALLVDPWGREARGTAAIAGAFRELRSREGAYVACSSRVLCNGDSALVVADGGTHVLRRTRGRVWRVTISLLDPTMRTEER
jgi:SnoaL-like domain